MNKKNNISLSEKIFLKYKSTIEKEKKFVETIIEQIKQISENNNNNNVAKLIYQGLLYLGYKEQTLETDIRKIENLNIFAQEIDEKRFKRDNKRYSLYNGKKNGQYWCDIFVDYLFIETFDYDRARTMLNQTSWRKGGAGVANSYEYYGRERFRSTDKKPEIGYQIFFENLSHTGLVCGVSDKYVYTLEGNAIPQVGKIISDGKGVCLKRYEINSPKIYGYGNPRFSKKEKITDEESTKVTELVSCLYDFLSKEMGVDLIQPQPTIKTVKNLKFYIKSIKRVVRTKIVLVKDWLGYYIKPNYESYKKK